MLWILAIFTASNAQNTGEADSCTFGLSMSFKEDHEFTSNQRSSINFAACRSVGFSRCTLSNFKVLKASINHDEGSRAVNVTKVPDFADIFATELQEARFRFTDGSLFQKEDLSSIAANVVCGKVCSASSNDCVAGTTCTAAGGSACDEESLDVESCRCEKKTPFSLRKVFYNDDGQLNWIGISVLAGDALLALSVLCSCICLCRMCCKKTTVMDESEPRVSETKRTKIEEPEPVMDRAHPAFNYPTFKDLSDLKISPKQKKATPTRVSNPRPPARRTPIRSPHISIVKHLRKAPVSTPAPAPRVERVPKTKAPHAVQGHSPAPARPQTPQQAQYPHFAPLAHQFPQAHQVPQAPPASPVQ